jgi:hypothetical protein
MGFLSISRGDFKGNILKCILENVYEIFDNKLELNLK